jgi:hypothetical protein
MPLEPGIAKSLAILARSVIFFSFNSARLILIVFISLILLEISLKLRPGTVLVGGLRAGAIQFPTGLAKKTGNSKHG